MTRFFDIRKFLSLLTAFCLFVSSSSIAVAQTFAELGFDITAPSISHEEAERAGVSGKMQSISAIITDNVAVKHASVFYLRSSAEQFQQATMRSTSAAKTWATTVDTTPQDKYVLYYIVAEDSEGNRVQKGGVDNPLRLELTTEKSLSLSLDQNNTTPASQNSPTATEQKTQTQSQTQWLLIALGVVAAGLLIGASGGGSSDGGIQSDDTCCTVTFNVENVGSN